jgi:hypothetical protein
LLGLLILIFGLDVQHALAQKFEINAYGGGIVPGRWRDEFQLRRNNIWGFKGGMFFADRFQLEGNFGYINHFNFENTTQFALPDLKRRAQIWEIGPSANFFSAMFERVVPFASIQVGVLHTSLDTELFDRFDRDVDIDDDIEDVLDELDDIDGITPILPITPLSFLDDRDGRTFFQFSYGGGIKALRLFGPVGLRAEVRGRTIPNFNGNSITWLEPTGGVTFSWGER